MTVAVRGTELDGVKIVEPTVRRDDRGFFLESYHAQDFAQAGIRDVFVQDNFSHSLKGVLRGFHFQDLSAPMAKLVRCVRGRILDVVVDLRADSPTFGRHVRAELDSEQMRQMLVPVGFGHAFLALSDWADVEYKCSGFYSPGAERIVQWNDPDIGVDWPVSAPTLSPRDQRGMSLREYAQAPAFRYVASLR